MPIQVREPNGSKTIYTDIQVERILDGCATELAMNFDVPAARILGVYGAKLGKTGDQIRQMLRDRIQVESASCEQIV